MEQADIESREIRRQRRLAAGRSGGVFEIVRDGGKLEYRYASPDLSCRHMNDMAWDSVESMASTTTTRSASKEGYAETLPATTMSSSVSIQTGGDGAEINEEEMEDEATARTRSRRGLRTLKKINRRVSQIVRRGDGTTKAVKSVTGAGELHEPRIPTYQHVRSSSWSPVKEQIELENDRDPGQEELNKDFFTPPRVAKAPFEESRDDVPGRKSLVFE